MASPKAAGAPVLPAPRAVLTSLINQIARIPLAPEPPLGGPSAASSTSTSRRPRGSGPVGGGPNALTRVPLEHRHLIITMHVLFPGLVLPALDLLDRGLATRVLPAVGFPAQAAPRADDVRRRLDDGAGAADLRETGPRARQGREPTSFFVVRSAAQTRGRPSRRTQGEATLGPAGATTSPSTGGQTYHVRLDAWNCTCAGFAYAAFPSSVPTAEEPAQESRPSSTTAARQIALDGAAGTADQGSPLDWSFGGLSFDGAEGGPAGDNVPICKHLLACLLAERWHAALGPYVVERRVGREEMAGIVADI